MPTLLEQLIAAPGEAEATLRSLNRSNPTDRQNALDTMEGVLNRFVVPAVNLLVPIEDDEGVYFNLQQIAGSDFADLMLGVLGKQFPALQAPPPDPVLKPLLGEHEFKIAEPEQREAFFRVWTAQRAIYVVRGLLKVVDDNLPGRPDINRQELNQLERLAQMKLPSLETMLFEGVISRRKSDLGSAG